MQMPSILCSAADAGGSGSWFIIFKVLMSNFTMLTILLRLNKFGLGSVADFSNTGTRAQNSVERTLCLSA